MSIWAHRAVSAQRPKQDGLEHEVELEIDGLEQDTEDRLDGDEPIPGKHPLLLDPRHPRSRATRRRHGERTGLPTRLLRRFEVALDTDLSHVRVHHDSAAAHRASEQNARAYTLGSDIHFAAGEFNPTTVEGQHLIAHEIAHTVQQTSEAATQFKLPQSQAHDPAEREADRAADAMVRGNHFSLSARPRGIARQEPERKTGGVPEVLDASTANIAISSKVPSTQAKVEGDSVLAQAQGVEMFGAVTLKPDIDPDPPEILAGWVQTVTSCKRVAVYQKAGVTVAKSIIGFESVRDAKPGAEAPWYVPPEKLTKDTRTVAPYAEDQPKLKFPAKQGDAEVTSLEGSDNFLVSLQVGTPGNLSNLQSFTWSAPWSVKVNPGTVTQGGGVAVGPAYSHPEPKNKGVANEVGKSADNKITTYETVEAAAAALSTGFSSFVGQLAKHKRLDRGSYWNMVTALWKSGVQIKVGLHSVGSSTVNVPLAVVSDKRVDLGEVATDASYSALGHMVYDPAALGPGHSIMVSVDHQVFTIDFPYSGEKTFKDIKVDDDDATINVVVSVG